MSTLATDDSHVIAMLCAPIALGDVKPMTLGEWSRLAELIHTAELKRPAALVGMSSHEIAEALPVAPPLAARVSGLLQRGGTLAFELERLQSRGVWMMTRADDLYPDRLKRRLKSKAPPVLFGVGSRDALSSGGVAIVGSREAPRAALEFTDALARSLAQEGTTVFSGAARGVDRVAMSSSTDAGGRAVGVVADSLLRLTQQADTRQLLEEDQLALVTPYAPDARFTAGNAMGRNKLIYCLADAAVVAATANGSGGTWAGATESLRHEWVPVWGWADDDAPTENGALVSAGARKLLIAQIPAENIAAWLSSPPTPTPLTRTSAPASDEDVFNAIWPILDAFLGHPRSEADVAERFELEKSQVRAWLRRAVQEGRLEKKTRPVRYVSVRSDSRDQTKLFDVA